MERSCSIAAKAIPPPPDHPLARAPQILNLEDIVEKEEGSDEVNVVVAKALVDAGAIQELKRAAQLDDEEARDTRPDPLLVALPCASVLTHSSCCRFDFDSRGA